MVSCCGSLRPAVSLSLADAVNWQHLHKRNGSGTKSKTCGTTAWGTQFLTHAPLAAWLLWCACVRARVLLLVLVLVRARVCMSVRAYLCLRTCAYVYMSLGLYAHMSVCPYVCMPVFMYAPTDGQTDVTDGWMDGWLVG